MSEKSFWEKPLAKLNREEWEALCDGCGLCCLNKVEDGDTGKLTFTSIACDLFECTACNCTDYKNRKKRVPDCVSFTMKNVYELDWLPPTCAYTRRAKGLPLLDWHYLISGSRETVHERGISGRGKVTAFERDVPDVDDYEKHELKLPNGE